MGDSESGKTPVIECADDMIADYKKASDMALPGLLFASFLGVIGVPVFVCVLVGCVVIGGCIVYTHLRSRRYRCVKCDSELLYKNTLKRGMFFECPDCGAIYQTDCVIDYSGAKPRKVTPR